MAETTTWLRPEGLSGVEALHASFERHAHRAHSHPGSAPAEVAVACGFADQAHLTRTFRRIVGVPPGRYARG